MLKSGRWRSFHRRSLENENVYSTSGEQHTNLFVFNGWLVVQVHPRPKRSTSSLLHVVKKRTYQPGCCLCKYEVLSVVGYCPLTRRSRTGEKTKLGLLCSWNISREKMRKTRMINYSASFETRSMLSEIFCLSASFSLQNRNLISL